MAHSLDPKKIKSAKRALEVLEYFQEDRGEATVMDIARSMGYPQSSTSELLSCLVALGYLTRNRNRRTYAPTARVAVLGARVQRNLFQEGNLLALMEEVARESGAIVVLGNRVGLEAQFIHVSSASGSEIIKPGSSVALSRSAIGRAMLGAMDRNSAKKLLHRLNAECAEPELRVPFDDLCVDFDKARAQGFSELEEQGGRMIAMMIRQNGEEGVALGMLLSEEQFRSGRDHYVALLGSAVERYRPRSSEVHQLRPFAPVSAAPQVYGRSSAVCGA